MQNNLQSLGRRRRGCEDRWYACGCAFRSGPTCSYLHHRVTYEQWGPTSWWAFGRGRHIWESSSWPQRSSWSKLSQEVSTWSRREWFWCGASEAQRRWASSKCLWEWNNKWKNAPGTTKNTSKRSQTSSWTTKLLQRNSMQPINMVRTQTTTNNTTN